MEISETIAKSLLHAVKSVEKNWPTTIQVESNIEAGLQDIAAQAPTHSPDFCKFLFSSRDSFRNELFLQTIPEELRQPITEKLKNQSASRARKEAMVAAQHYHEAARFRDEELKQGNDITRLLSGRTAKLTSAHVRTTLEKLGWSSV